MTNIIEARIKIMREMDIYARENFEEDTFYGIWLVDGVPDESDDDTLFEIASIEICWKNIVEAFGRCCKVEGII